jgi:hypothetical protein
MNPAITFYATPAEAASWISEWKKQHDLYCVFGRVLPTPGLTQEVDWDDAGGVQRVVEQYPVAYFGIEPMDVDVTSVNQIARKNPDHLQINLPTLTPKGLRWASLGSVSKRPEAVRVWKGIAKDLVHRTASGLWFDMPGRHKPNYEKNVRYSQGAESLSRAGTALLGGGKTVVVRLDAGLGEAGTE